MASTALTAYRLLLPFLLGAARLAARFIPELDAFFAVRKGGLNRLEAAIAASRRKGPRIWIHAASVGEFEQARPLVARLRNRYSDAAIFVSFLSESGYNARKEFPGVEAVFYLPADSWRNARRTTKIIRPQLVVLMRYDFWPNHLAAARKSGARLALAAGVLQTGSAYRRQPARWFYRSVFQLFDHIYTVEEKDSEAFRTLFGCSRVTTAGDPRVEQVVIRSRDTSPVDFLKPFYAHRKALVCGSVWPADTTLLLAAWKKLGSPLPLVLAPHKVDEEHLAPIEKQLRESGIAWRRLSNLDECFDASQETLLVDRTGILLELYAIAAIAYVGGGFGINVHNTLEPAAHGLPVLFGPRHRNSPEAEALIGCGGAAEIADTDRLEAMLKRLIEAESERERMSRASAAFITANAGAAGVVADGLVALLGGEVAG